MLAITHNMSSNIVKKVKGRMTRISVNHCKPKNYLHRSMEDLMAYEKHVWSMKLIRDQFQVFLASLTGPPRHFWPKDGKSLSPTHFEC
jgi:hypothetical protein